VNYSVNANKSKIARPAISHALMRKSALILIPALIVAAIMLASWPGYLSFDSASQWQQARHGVFKDVAPPLLPALWRLFMLCGLPSTSGPLLLVSGLSVFGFARLACNAEAYGQSRLASVWALFGPLCPLLVLLLPHVWTDLLLTAALLAAGALLIAPRFGRLAQFSVLVLLALATAARHNGILAVLPLATLMVWRIWPATRLLRRSLATVGVLTLLLASKWLLSTALVEQRVDTWAVTPMYDLQAVSLATGKQLLPTNLVGQGVNVKQLAVAFHPYSASMLFSGTQLAVVNPTLEQLTGEQSSALWSAWLALPLQPTWWSHRWRLFRGLLGPHRAPGLVGLVDSPRITAYGDNPPLQTVFPAAHTWYRLTASAIKEYWLGAAVLYLLLGLVGGTFLWWRSRRVVKPNPADQLLLFSAFALLASAWLYTLPYFLLAPSSETRYVLWPALASWLIALLAACHKDIDCP
jgi:hypothetical protein